MKQRYGKPDSNHSQVKDWYSQLGCSVADCKDAAGGVPDLFVCAAGVVDAVEVKSEDGELTPAQRTFIATWRARVWIVRTFDDVVAHNADMRRRARRVTPKEVYA